MHVRLLVLAAALDLLPVAASMFAAPLAGTAVGQAPAATPTQPAADPDAWKRLPIQSLDRVPDVRQTTQPLEIPAAILDGQAYRMVTALLDKAKAGGDAGDRAMRHLEAMGYPALLLLINRLREVDYTDRDAARFAMRLNAALTTITLGSTVGYVPIAADEAMDPRKALWNARTVEQWQRLVRERWPTREAFEAFHRTNYETFHRAKIDAAFALVQKTRTFVDQLKFLETQFAADPPVEQLAKLFAMVRDGEFASQAADLGGNYKTHYDADVRAVTSKYIEALRGKAAAAAAAATGEGLAPFGPLEDALRTVVEAAMAANDVDTVNQYQGAYKQCVREINQIAAKLFDEAYVAKQPWRDLLAEPGSWMVAETGSFTRKFAGGSLLVDNAEGGQVGGVLYMPGAQWRDYVLELEVKLDRGKLTVYTRVGDENTLDTNAVPGFSFGTKNTTVLAEYGKTQTLTVRVIGKQITVFVDRTAVLEDTLGLNKSRRGKPCLAVSPGTTATISRLRVQLLR